MKSGRIRVTVDGNGVLLEILNDIVPPPRVAWYTAALLPNPIFCENVRDRAGTAAVAAETLKGEEKTTVVEMSSVPVESTVPPGV